MSQNNLKTAYETFTKTIEMDSDWAEAWNKRATVLYLMGEYELSQSDIDKVLEIENRHFGALSGQGLVQTALKNYQKAINRLGKGSFFSFKKDLLNIFELYLSDLSQRIVTIVFPGPNSFPSLIAPAIKCIHAPNNRYSSQNTRNKKCKTLSTFSKTICCST